MNKFSEIILDVEPKIELLPLFHSCDTYGLRAILEDKKLITHQCDVFTSEKLLYCFYGKSSYRISLDGATNNLAYFPTCFILKTEALPKPRKVYPFDTGAFVKLDEIKKEFFHKNMDVNDFIVGHNIDSARALVETFYSTNRNYFNVAPTISEDDIPPFNLEARSYLQLIKEKRQARFDDRLSSIEIVFDEDIQVNEATVETIILPGAFYDDRQIKNKINNELQISSPILYNTHRGNPIEFHGLILSEIEKLLKTKSLL